MNPSPTKIPQIKTRGLPTCFELSVEEKGGDAQLFTRLQVSTRENGMPPGTPGYKIKQAFQENLAAANSCSATANLISPRSVSGQTSPRSCHMAGPMSPADKQVAHETTPHSDQTLLTPFLYAKRRG
jgi:hypothetical protein